MSSFSTSSNLETSIVIGHVSSQSIPFTSFTLSPSIKCKAYIVLLALFCRKATFKKLKIHRVNIIVQMGYFLDLHVVIACGYHVIKMECI